MSKGEWLGILIYALLMGLMQWILLTRQEAEPEPEEWTVFVWADSIARSKGVPPELVREIGMNESRWPHPTDSFYLIRDGDLQVIPRSYNILYKKLGLTGGKTRYNYLVTGIHYLSELHEKYQSWEKTRYAYGRGIWKHPSKWTRMERAFMRKIDWTKYDSIPRTKSYVHPPTLRD